MTIPVHSAEPALAGMQQTALRFHPLAEIFPLMDGEDFETLVADIRDHALREPITLYEACILDGRNRYRACLAAGVVPRFREWSGEGLAVDFVWSLNGPRRHLDGAARQLAAGRYAIAREDEASRRRLSGLRNVGSLLQTCSDEAGRSAALAAERFDVAERTVAHATKVLKQGAPELVQAVAAGGISVSTGSDLASKPLADQQEIVARGKAEILKAAKAIREERSRRRRAERVQRLVAIAAGNQELPTDRRYAIIYADPPWRYEHPTMSESREVENHYPTMEIEAICALPVHHLATDDALLFVWVPPPILEQCFRVIRAWGFDYRTGLVWVKDRIGMGNYVRNQHEHLLIARRGKLPLPTVESRPPSVMEAPRTVHSRKPVTAYELIEQMYPELPRIELFARSPRSGWSAWGNEVAASQDAIEAQPPEPVTDAGALAGAP